MRRGLSPPSSSARVASLRLALPRAAAASSQCRRRVGYSLPVSVCRTLELVMSTARLASLSGTGTVSRDLQGELSHVPAPRPAPALKHLREATWQADPELQRQSPGGLGFHSSISLPPNY